MVRNEFGVLNRVTSMFRRRQFNITGLTVSETETEDLSRITVQFEGEDRAKTQLVAQLAKAYRTSSRGRSSIPRTPSRASSCSSRWQTMTQRVPRLLDAAEAFHAKTVDYTRESIVFRIAGQTHRIDNFIDLMRDFEILEVCRTGVVSLERGHGVMRRNVASV